jgi:hypothetical protein
LLTLTASGQRPAAEPASGGRNTPPDKEAVRTDHLRNLADILEELGGSEPAFFLRTAAACAPDAPPAPTLDEPSAQDLDAQTIARLRTDAASASRSHVLQIARDAIDAALDHQQSNA